MSAGTRSPTAVAHRSGGTAGLDPHRVPGATRLEGVVLPVLACLLAITAPVEGYLAGLHPALPKVPGALLVLAWGAWRLRRRRPPTLHVGAVELAALASIVLLSSARHLGEPLTTTSTLRWLSFLVIAYVLLDLFSEVVAPRLVAMAFLGGAVIAGLGALVSFTVLGDPRATGPMPDPNDLAYTLVAAVPFGLLLGRRGTSPGHLSARAATVQAGVVLVLVAGAAVTFSRGAAVGLAAGLLVLLACRPRLVRPRMLAVLAVISLLGVAALAVTSSDELARAVREKAHIADTNVDVRVTRWSAALEMLGEEPLLGVGPGEFRARYGPISDDAEPAGVTGVTHQMYLEVGAELGAVALAVFLSICARTLVSVERARRRGNGADFPTAALAASVTVLVTSLFLSEQYYLPLWLLVATGLSLDRRRTGTPGGGP